ncbi:MAG: trigger factor [Saprospiraceae bacterium]|jgi:trigger factor
MKIELIETGHLASQLTIVLDPADYKDKFDKELKEYRKKAHLKGFRKGKTPLSAIRKMYGKGVLAEVINTKLQDTLTDYITEKELNILGNPIPAEDQVTFDFDTKTLETFEFKFDIGQAPVISVKGVDPSESYESYVVEYDDSRVEEEITQLQKRAGEQAAVDGPIEMLDLVKLEITELNPPEERDAWVNDISILPERMTEPYQNEFLGKVKDFQLDVDIYLLEADTKEDYVKKYFLTDAPEDITATFSSKVVEIKRLVIAEISDEFFEKVFDPKDEIKDIDAAKEFIKKDLDKHYTVQANAITQRKILEALLELNVLELPDDFLKRWLMSSNEELTEEQLEVEFGDFKKNLTWTLIKQELAKQYEIEVTPESVKEGVKADIQAQLTQYGYGMMDGFDFDAAADRMMEKQETVQKKYEEILAKEVMDKISEKVALVEKKISLKEYEEIVKQFSK